MYHRQQEHRRYVEDDERSGGYSDSHTEQRRGDRYYDGGERRRYDNRGGEGGRRGGKHHNRRQYTYQAEISADKGEEDITTEEKDLPIEEIEKRALLTEKVSSFEDLNLELPIMRGIFSHGFETPSPIQQVAVRPMMSGYDIIAQAQSGLGKTATFCIGALTRINMDDNFTQIVILSHTREMASQIWAVMTSLNKYLAARVNLCTPAVSHSQNINELLGVPPRREVDSWGKRDKVSATEEAQSASKPDSPLIPQVVIGTPGRILDMIKQNALKVDRLKVLVLDEADELLGDGFQEQIRTIISYMNEGTQIALFSATYNASVFKLTRHFLNKPIRILVKNEELTLDGIKQYYVNVLNNQYKFETLCDIYGVLTISQTIIFCNNQRTVDYLAKKMRANNFTVACIHGDMSVIDREQTMSEFRSGKSKVLIATDVIGRGIDVQSVSIVINYELPHKISSYIHRIGRSGRYGRKGCGISFVCEDDTDVAKLKQIQSYYQTEIRELPAQLESILN